MGGVREKKQRVRGRDTVRERGREGEPEGLDNVIKHLLITITCSGSH